MGVVVAAGDAAAHLSLDEIELVFAEGGAGEDIVESGEHFVGAFFERGERDGAVAFADLAFDGGGDVFEFLVDLVAGFGGGAAAADQGAGDGGEADFIGGVEEVAGADQSAGRGPAGVRGSRADRSSCRWGAWIPRLWGFGFP